MENWKVLGGDYRIYNPDKDGKTKLEHITDRLHDLVFHKAIALFATVN